MIVVLSGPSGVGKNTVGEELLAMMGEMTRVVTATTRAPRGQERDGVDYHFWSDEKFRQARESGVLLEWAAVLDKCYGTPLAAVVEALSRDKIVLLIIDVVGARQVKQMVPEALMVFLDAPGDDELERRLRGRGTESDDKVRDRLKRALQEREYLSEYDAVIVNRDVKDCVEQVAAIVRRSRAEAKGSGAWKSALARLRELLTRAGH